MIIPLYINDKRLTSASECAFVIFPVVTRTKIEVGTTGGSFGWSECTAQRRRNKPVYSDKKHRQVKDACDNTYYFCFCGYKTRYI